MHENKLYWHLIDNYSLSHLEATRLIGEIWPKVSEYDLDYDIDTVETIIEEALA